MGRISTSPGFNSTSLENDCRSFVSGELKKGYLSASTKDEDLFDLDSKMSLWLTDEAVGGRTTQYFTKFLVSC